MIGECEEVVARYWSLIRKGESPGMASILASRCAPSLETDTNHFVGQRPLEEVAGKAYAEKVRKEAIKAGIPITPHSRYNGTIADKRGGGDPAAWLHNGENVDKWRKAVQEKGSSCESLRAKSDGRIAEIEEKRKSKILKNRANEQAKQEFVADKKKKLGLPG